jgi:hypothetical protein
MAQALTAVESSTVPAPLDALLTAHFATVATFVPTDVDARIRHHARGKRWRRRKQWRRHWMSSME